MAPSSRPWGRSGASTGYPTWTLLARMFALAWPGEPAHRVTALSAVAGALALVVLMRVLKRLTSPAAALAGAVLVGASLTVRWASIYPEVYAVAVLLLVVAARRERCGPSRTPRCAPRWSPPPA